MKKSMIQLTFESQGQTCTLYRVSVDSSEALAVANKRLHTDSAMLTTMTLTKVSIFYLFISKLFNL